MKIKLSHSVAHQKLLYYYFFVITVFVRFLCMHGSFEWIVSLKKDHKNCILIVDSFRLMMKNCLLFKKNYNNSCYANVMLWYTYMEWIERIAFPTIYDSSYLVKNWTSCKQFNGHIKKQNLKMTHDTLNALAVKSFRHA